MDKIKIIKIEKKINYIKLIVDYIFNIIIIFMMTVISIYQRRTVFYYNIQIKKNIEL